MSNLSISVIDNFKDWQELAPQWNRLLEESESATFFLTWEWLSSWAECCFDNYRSLFILSFYEKDKLVGIAPFYIQKKKAGLFRLREIRFLGTPEAGSDYLSVFARKGREQKVANALYDYLTMGEGKKVWDQLNLHEIPANSLFLLHFMARIESRGKFVEVSLNSYCPRMKLPETEEEFYAMLSPGWRKKFKQDIRVINREQAVYHSVSQDDNISQKMKEFFRLYEVKGGRSVNRIKAILELMIAKYNSEPPILIDLLAIDGRNVAGLVHLKYQSTLSMYLMAVDKDYNPKVSLGNSLIGQSIKNAIAARYSVYDFLKGEERYKFHWATGGNRTLQLFFWRKTPASLYSALTRISRHAGKILLR
jgi:CelD/BcsL family acetyltransferase involved in cellulose biosynthesis